MKPVFLIAILIFALALPFATGLSAQEADDDTAQPVLTDELKATLDNFWKVMAYQSDKAFCDSLVASGFVPNDYSAYLSDKLLADIENAGIEIDDYYYYYYYSEDEIDEIAWDWEQDLLGALDNMKDYKISLTAPDQLVQMADEYYFYDLSKAIAEYSLE
ncbi:MAG TPA: hypothetical protein PL124_05040 [Candidatus Cloacimonadota bacterium]|nr:hypothetical protein [Candidatus Cloacimonadota bacterium]HPS38761.1 hypothetical protein [Candidatus Cloacimonadota bacterium]